MKLFKILLINTYIIFFILSASLADKNTKILVKVGNEIITNFELENKIKTTLLLAGEELNQKNINSVKNRSVNSLINLKLKMEEINRYNFKEGDNDSRIKNHLKKIASRFNVQTADLRNIFLVNQIDYDQYLSELKTEFTWQNLIYKIYSGKISLDENQILNELNDIIENTEEINEFNLAEIEIKIPIKKDKEKILNEVINHIEKFGFENAATKYSVSSSSLNGGDLGWISYSGLSEKIKNLTKSLKIGNYDKIEINLDTIIFLKLKDKRSVSTKDKINVDQLKNSLINKQRNDLLTMYSNNHISKKKNNTLIEFK